MMRVLLTLTFVAATLGFAPSVANAQDAGPGSANNMKLEAGEVGSDSIRIRVQHDPAIFSADSWEVIGQTPGEADSTVRYACDWTSTGAPAAQAGLFNCDLNNLAVGNHFLTLQAKNATRDDSDPNTFLWHTVGPATGIVDASLPGTFATSGSAGAWDNGGIEAAQISAQKLAASWPGYTPSNKVFPAVGYLITVSSPNGLSQFVADRTAMELFLTAGTYGEATITILPVTARGLINDPLTMDLDIENRVANYNNALSLAQLVGAENFDSAADPEILRYYVAYFDRQPDLEGAKYWLGIRRQGFGAGEIAGFMSGSTEFANNYTGTDNREYLTRIYANVLGREFDQGGFDYWLDTLEGTNRSGNNPTQAQISRSEVVFFVAQSAEFTANNPFGA